MAELGTWLYAISRPFPPERLAGLTGVAGGRVHTVEADDLSAVVSTVSLADYGSDALRRNLEDLDWLAATARAHDAVVDAVGRIGPAVPSRLATVFLDDARVRQMLTERHDDLLSALDLLTGRTEWGVKAYAEPADTAEPKPGGGSGHTGTAYLLRRKAQLAAREKAERAATQQAEQVHNELAELAKAARRHPPQAPQLTGTSARMTLNGTYLVDDARRDEFAARVVALDAEHPGIRLELTGPWPPYSFAGLERAEP